MHLNSVQERTYGFIRIHSIRRIRGRYIYPTRAPVHLARTYFADGGRPARTMPRQCLFLSNEMLIVPSRVSRAMYNRLLAYIKSNEGTPCTFSLTLPGSLRVRVALASLPFAVYPDEKKVPFRRPTHDRSLHWISSISHVSLKRLSLHI